MSIQRPMTLEEYCGQLPSIHTARKQFEAQKKRITDMEASLRESQDKVEALCHEVERLRNVGNGAPLVAATYNRAWRAARAKANDVLKRCLPERMKGHHG